MKLFQKNKKRPCECGCRHEDHVKLPFEYKGPSMTTFLYCEKCGKTGDVWCYKYRPCGNLEYLEWLVK